MRGDRSMEEMKELQEALRLIEKELNYIEWDGGSDTIRYLELLEIQVKLKLFIKKHS
jgi:hypothetical protein